MFDVICFGAYSLDIGVHFEGFAIKFLINISVDFCPYQVNYDNLIFST